MFACSACTGLIDGVGSGGSGSAGGEDPPAAKPRETFEREVLPLLNANCKGCHVDAEHGWMKAAPDEYTSVMAWPHLVEVLTPESSQLLTKGQHQGPAWTVEQAATVLSWIVLERSEHETTEGPETTAIAVVDGQNSIRLDDAGAAGSMLAFTAQRLQLGLYLSNIAVTAGTGGVHLTHPLFVTWKDTTPSPDPVDSFDTVDMNVEEGMTGTVGGGLLLLPDIQSDAMLSVSFKQIGPAKGGGSSTLPGCKAVASFTQNARAQLSQSCVSCHGGTDGGATSATDMTKINDTSEPGQTAACGQILGRVNLTTPDQSGIFLAADPNSGTSHPFKLAAGAFTTFKNSLSVWIQAEKAP